MRTLLIEERGLTVSLSRYAGGARQPKHRDRRSRISLVLRGGFREDGPSGSAAATAGNILIKSRTVLHEDVFAPDGALLLSVEFDERDGLLASVGAGCWRMRADAAAIRIAGALLEAALARNAIMMDAASADLLASGPEAGEPRREAPPWLMRLKQEVETSGLAETDISARAQEAGVHAAHVSRLFRCCFGASITDHARMHGVRRAIALMAQPGAKLSDVALAAGFYDQSHMNRTFKRVSGRPPGAYRRLMEGAARLAAG